MSYKALYRKYRPNNFEEVLGQNHIVTTLQNIISQEKISHAYLFAGPRGTGKTSVAHIFAREINRNAAGQVKVNLMDIIEMDAASNNGVAEIRNVIEGSKYAPSESRYKVYIIDEAHMLTKGAFNALLKTLEEPPEHVVFILATTEPEKVPITILSRLQRFNFRRIEQSVIISQLEEVLKKEEITFDNEAIRFIARLARGGMRDALSIADQAAAYGNNTISFGGISQVFGLVSIENQINLMNLAFKGETKELLTLTSRFIDGGIDIERVTMSLIDVLKDYIVHEKTADKSLLEAINSDEVEKFEITTEFGYEALESLMKLLNELRYSQVPTQSFELALLKMVKNNSIMANLKTIDNEEISKPIIKQEETIAIIKEKEEEKEDNIFATEEMQTPSENENIMSTDELALTQENILNAAQDEFEKDIVDEDILSTQEIEIPSVDQTTTEEINIVDMFAKDDEDEDLVEEIDISTSEIINLLIQSNKEDAAKAKNNLSKVGLYAKDAKSSTYASLLEDVAIISKGNNFILITSKDENKVLQLKADRNSSSFIEFVKDVFKEPIRVFAITIEEFNLAKKAYKDLYDQNNLPKPKQIYPPTLAEKPASEAEKLGSSLFGELFSR